MRKTERTANALRLVFVGPAGERVVALRPAEDPRAYQRTPSFAIAYEGAGDADALGLADALAARVRANDRGELTLPAATTATTATASAAGPDSHRSGDGRGRPATATEPAAGSPLDRPLHVASLGLLLLVLLALGHGLVGALGSIRPDGAAERWSRALPWVVAVGVALRAFAPTRWVMEHMGETLLDEVLAAWQGGPTPKYGPWLTALYGGLAQVHPALESLAVLHRLASMATLLLAIAWLRRLGLDGRALTLAALALAATPALWLDAATESMLVPTMTLAVGGAAAATAALRPRAGESAALALAGATSLWVAAIWSRPEMIGLGPLLAVAVIGLRQAPEPGAPSLRPAAWIGAGAVLAAAVGLRMLQLDDALALEAARGNTPEVFAGGLPARIGRLLRDGLFRKNVLLEGRVFPIALTVTLALGLLGGPSRARRVGATLAALGLAAMVPAAADLPWVSLPRVGAPAMTFAALAAGPLADSLLRRGGDGGARTAILLALWALTAGATFGVLLQQSPADRDRAALLAALAQVEAAGHAPGRLARRDHNDPPGERVHLGFPDALLRARGYRPIGLREARAGDWVWLDARCTMRACDAPTEHPTCRVVRSVGALEPMVTHLVADRWKPIPPAFERNRKAAPGWRQDRDFPWCIPEGGYEIGLYRLRGTPTPTPRQSEAINAPKAAIR
ncbi:MAG: hypothetical protein RIT45_2815 [Pseudomonadota bacterium]